MTNTHPLYLGFDTGGTYTDAVLWRDDGAHGEIVATAKALTTRHDLSLGISQAAGKVLAESRTAPAAVKLVSMSTTLATNALVEGQGNRTALVMAGFADKDLARDGLAEALGSDPVVLLAGGHDVHGKPNALDLKTLEAQLAKFADSVSAVAVAALFAVRNPEHEIAMRDFIRARTGLPVTCSHELSSKLGGPRRALTTLLNARLIAMIDRLIAATQRYLESAGIHAPLMVVRGDGALVSADFARSRPIETILSGPAASLVGARHLTGLDNAIVSDIGGTTTDVAILDKGRPRIDPDGATVGGFKTMVEAVAMRTHGLGGDSEVRLDDGGLETKLLLGPRRLVPLSLAASLNADAVLPHLERQLSGLPGRMDGRFAWSAGLPDELAAGLGVSERTLFDRLTALPQPLDKLFSTNAQAATLNRLVARGLAFVSGFTPSDAAHVLGRQANWNAEGARFGAALFARRKDGRGMSLAATPEAFSERVLDAIARRSAEVILETAFAEDGLSLSALAAPVVQHALDGKAGIARFALSLDRPVIGLGASAGLHYATLGARLGADCVIPAEAGVANAVGAVVGQVRVSVTATVARPSEDRFRVTVAETVRDFRTEAEALDFAEKGARNAAEARARDAGTDEPHVSVSSHIEAPQVDGQRKFIAAEIVAAAKGRARIAH